MVRVSQRDWSSDVCSSDLKKILFTLINSVVLSILQKKNI